MWLHAEVEYGAGRVWHGEQPQGLVQGAQGWHMATWWGGGVWPQGMAQEALAGCGCVVCGFALGCGTGCMGGHSVQKYGGGAHGMGNGQV